MRRKKTDLTEVTTRQLRIEIEKAQSDMELAFANFDFAVEPDLIDAYIYELNAIQKRYCYLLKQIKAPYTEEQIQAG